MHAIPPDCPRPSPFPFEQIPVCRSPFELVYIQTYKLYVVLSVLQYCWTGNTYEKPAEKPNYAFSFLQRLGVISAGLFIGYVSSLVREAGELFAFPIYPPSFTPAFWRDCILDQNVRLGFALRLIIDNILVVTKMFPVSIIMYWLNNGVQITINITKMKIARLFKLEANFSHPLSVT